MILPDLMPTGIFMVNVVIIRLCKHSLLAVNGVNRAGFEYKIGRFDRHDGTAAREQARRNKREYRPTR